MGSVNLVGLVVSHLQTDVGSPHLFAEVTENPHIGSSRRCDLAVDDDVHLVEVDSDGVLAGFNAECGLACLQCQFLAEKLFKHPEVGAVLSDSADTVSCDAIPIVSVVGEFSGEAEVLHCVDVERCGEYLVLCVVGQLLAVVGSPTAFQEVTNHPQVGNLYHLFLDYESHGLEVERQVVGARRNLECLVALVGEGDLNTKHLVGNQEVTFAHSTEALVGDFSPAIITGLGCQSGGEAEVGVTVDVHSLQLGGVNIAVGSGHLLALGRIPVAGGVTEDENLCELFRTTIDDDVVEFRHITGIDVSVTVDVIKQVGAAIYDSLIEGAHVTYVDVAVTVEVSDFRIGINRPRECAHQSDERKE